MHLANLTLGAMTLVDDYTGSGFYRGFDFFNKPDPTHGFVQYLDMHTANATGLAGLMANNNSDPSDWAVYLGSDYTNITPNGRPSLRLESKKTYNSGLFIADIAHMPGEICGTWPAYWLLGTALPWPQAGEVGIIEGIHLQNTTLTALHTGGPFPVSNATSLIGGLMESTDCHVYSPNQPPNKGCVVSAQDTNTYGVDFNLNGGGVSAVSISEQGIIVWFFPRGQVPEDISAGLPQPNTWSKPLASFSGPSLDFNSSFSEMKIIWDLTFCGDWAGKPQRWAASPCSQLADTCEAFVANNPEAFAEAYWQINSLKVYQQNGVGSLAPSQAVPPFANRTSAYNQQDTSAVSLPKDGALNGTTHHDCTHNLTQPHGPHLD